MACHLLGPLALVLVLFCHVATCGPCTFNMSNTINPATGLPYCARVGLLKQGVSSAPYFTNQLPLMVLEKTIGEVPEVDFNVTQTDLIWGQGIDAVAASEYDIFVANIWVLRSRVRRIDFSAAFLTETLGLIYVIPDSGAGDRFRFLNPFDAYLWVAFFVTFLVGTLCVAFAEFLHVACKPGAESGLVVPQQPWATFRRVFWCNMNVPFGTMEQQPGSSAGKIVLWVFNFMYLILIASYTANLASVLTVEQTQGFVDKAKLLNEGQKVAVTPGDIGPFITALGGSTERIGFDELGRAGLERPGVGSIAVSDTNAEGLIAKDCGLRFLRLDIPVDSAMVFRQSPAMVTLKRKIDAELLRLKEEGVLDRWKTAGLPVNNCTQAGDLTSGTMVFSHVEGIFLCAAVIIGTTLLAAVILAVFRRLRSNKVVEGAAETGCHDGTASKSRSPLSVQGCDSDKL